MDARAAANKALKQTFSERVEQLTVIQSDRPHQYNAGRLERHRRAIAEGERLAGPRSDVPNRTLISGMVSAFQDISRGLDNVGRWTLDLLHTLRPGAPVVLGLVWLLTVGGVTLPPLWLVAVMVLLATIGGVVAWVIETTVPRSEVKARAVRWCVERELPPLPPEDDERPPVITAETISADDITAERIVARMDGRHVVLDPGCVYHVEEPAEEGEEYEQVEVFGSGLTYKVRVR